jgi:hypothetical protein
LLALKAKLTYAVIASIYHVSNNTINQIRKENHFPPRRRKRIPEKKERKKPSQNFPIRFIGKDPRK